MSAIAVVLDLRGDRLDPAVFERVFRAIDDRGPDGRGAWVSGPIGIGQQSFAITPEEVGETQPVAIDDVVGVFDGRLDNREQLIAALDSVASEGQVLTDAELVVHAYRAWGDHAVERLLGDFGFAVWDARLAHLYCARDHLGQRPIYYWENGRTLVISTDIHAVLAAPGFIRAPNEQHVADLLSSRLRNRTDTLYEGIRRLPGAHALTARRAPIRVSRYWEPDFSAPPHQGSTAEVVDEFIEILRAAVRCRLRTHKELAVALSGGLDSSLVMALAVDEQRRRGEKVAAVSITFPGLECDEAEWIRLVTDHLDVPSLEFPWEPASWQELEEEARQVLYIPSYPNSMFRVLDREGFRNRSILTGSGGDQWLAGGYGYFRDCLTQRHYGELARSVLDGAGPMFAHARGSEDPRRGSAVTTEALRPSASSTRRHHGLVPDSWTIGHLPLAG